MTRIDGTKNLRKLKYLPDVTPLCSVLLALISFLFCIGVNPFHLGCYHPHYVLPETFNGRWFDDRRELPVFIDINGDVHIASRTIDDLSDFSIELEDRMIEEKESDRKVILKVDQNVEFGKVQQVLELIRKSKLEIKVVGLITKERASFFELR